MTTSEISIQKELFEIRIEKTAEFNNGYVAIFVKQDGEVKQTSTLVRQSNGTFALQGRDAEPQQVGVFAELFCKYENKGFEIEIV